MCTCKVGPGKFEGERALIYIAWQSAMLGTSDATTGDSEWGTLTDWMFAPFHFDADPETVQAAREYGYCEACIAEALADESAGLALWESEQGFVYGAAYATREEFDKALADAEVGDDDNG